VARNATLASDQGRTIPSFCPHSDVSRSGLALALEFRPAPSGRVSGRSRDNSDAKLLKLGILLDQDEATRASTQLSRAQADRPQSADTRQPAPGGSTCARCRLLRLGAATNRPAPAWTGLEGRGPVSKPLAPPGQAPPNLPWRLEPTVKAAPQDLLKRPEAQPSPRRVGAHQTAVGGRVNWQELPLTEPVALPLVSWQSWAGARLSLRYEHEWDMSQPSAGHDGDSTTAILACLPSPSRTFSDEARAQSR